MPPAPTTSTRPPATASASSRGNPRDRAMAGRPRAATQAEAGELRPRPEAGGGRATLLPFLRTAAASRWQAPEARIWASGPRRPGLGFEQASHTWGCTPA